MLAVFTSASLSFTKPKEFAEWNNTEYKEKFLVPVVYKNNEKDAISVEASSSIWWYGGSSVDRAFDLSTYWTHWEGGSSIYNSSADFNVTFSKPITFKRVLYRSRIDIEKGWPKKFSIYGRKEGSEEDSLLFNGGLTANPQNPVDIVLDETVTITFMTFRFLEVYLDWPSMSILAFMLEDKILEQAGTIFTDGTWSELADPNFDIDAFEALVDDHPLKSAFEHIFEVVYQVKNDPTIKDTVRTIKCVNSGAQQGRSQTGQLFAYMNATGKAIHYNESIDVYCENYDNSVYASVLFSKTYDFNGEDFQTFGAPTGHSVHTPNKFIGSQFAEIMFRCNGDVGDQIKTLPKCRYTGGIKIPQYKLGDNITEFKQFLTEYVETMNTDITSLEGKPNVAELVGEDIIITNKADVLLEQMNKDEPNNITIDMNVKAWEQLPVQYNKYSGFEENATKSCNRPVLGTFLNRINTDSNNPYAWSYSYYTYYSSDFFPGLASYTSITSGGWGYYHEWGHSYDCGPLIISETTNNLYALYMSRYFGSISRLDEESRWDGIGRVVNGNVNTTDNVFEWLCALRQMEIFIGEDTVAKMNRLAREGFFSIVDRDHRWSRWALGLSNISGYNCAEHFQKLGFEVTEEFTNLTNNLPKLPIKTWLITERVYQYKGSGLPKGVKPKVLFVINNNGNLQLQLSISEYKENSFEDILGFEIRNEAGETVGWTYTSTWTSVHNDFFNTKVKYYIYAMDLLMNESEPTVFEWGPYESIVELNDEDTNFKAYPYPSNVTECTREDNHAISGILDRDPRTCYFTEKQEGKSFPTGFILDLSETVTFRGILHNNARGDWGRTQRFQLSISDDNETWNTFLKGDNITMPNRDSNENRYIYFDKEYSAKYFRFEQLDERMGTTHFTSCDFALLGLRKGSETENNDDPNGIKGNDNKESDTNTAAIVGGVVGGVVAIVLITVGVVFLIKCKRSQKLDEEDGGCSEEAVPV